MNMKILVACIIVGLLVFTCGCTEQEDEGNAEVTTPTALVTIQVADKVTDTFSHVNVTFSEVKIHEQMDDDASWITITSTPTTVDLISLNLSSINATLGTAEIEEGNYSMLWINVSKVVGVLASGEEVNITVPSGWLKIQQLHLFNLSRGNHTITIDIDLENSIHTFHGGEEYKFIPVISRMDHRHEKELKHRWREHEEIRNMVGNRAPAIDILVNGTLVKNNARIIVDEDVEFNASATLDVDGDELTFTWEFGDGTTEEGAVVTHNYSSAGTYHLTLTVTDGTDEAIAVVTINVHVRESGNGNGNGQG